MLSSSRNSRSIAMVVGVATAFTFACAAPLSSLQTSKREFHDTKPELGGHLVLVQKDLIVDGPESVHSSEFNTYTDDNAHYLTLTPSSTQFIVTATGAVLLESITSSSSASAPSASAGDPCSMPSDLSTEHRYHVTVLALQSCTLVTLVVFILYLVFRQWRSKHSRPWVSVYSPNTPKSKRPRLSLSLPGSDGLLRHKPSTATLFSISEEPAPPAKQAKSSPHPPSPTSNPPSYSSGAPISESLAESPVASCIPAHISLSSRQTEKPSSSFLKLQG